MEQHRDERIQCADCGAPFVFTAIEANIFTARGLTPPRRCKDCRLARKSRAANGEAPRASGGARHAGQGSYAGRGRPGGVPRYTGDVNEYRSPMQDKSFAARAALPARDGNVRPARGGFGGARANALQAPRGVSAVPAPAKEKPAARRPRAARPETPKFAITCSTCGAAAEVPFAPAEGREVFCGTCYRARRAPPTA